MRNYSIQELILEAYQEKVNEKNTRDIGKFLQFVAEGYARCWLKEECEINSEGAKNDEKGNETTWDILTEANVRDQVKYRGGKQGKSGRPKLFLETTRRNSKKNAGAKSASGHVAYGSDEFDVALFIIPKEDFDFLNTEGFEVIAIPVKELVNPDHPEILLKNVPAAIMDKYRGKAKEIVLSIENAKRVQNRG
jgi:hypothetical protein